MALAAGTRIGPYEITGPLGGGGMGEVYRAHDTALGRSVALKILPHLFANDPDRTARFQREARTLALLNHPHIAHVYGLEQSSGSAAIVMELVEGLDLAEQLARGPIPLEEALPIAIQIALALEAAHNQGIIHRDLKPANIKVRPDRTVKVLDFGLAKGLESPPDAGAGHEALNSPTLTSPPGLTSRGLVLGTAAYMSPEQARGHPVDRRTDIWAFGVVLYEMLTGRPAFAAETVSDTIAAVLTREPDLDALPAGSPETVRRVLWRCLQKDPARRFHHIADVRIELEHAEPAPGPHPPRSAPPARARWAAVLAAAAASALLTGLVAWMVLSPRAQPSRRYSFTVPGAGFNTVSYSAISPDGRWIAYSPNVHAAPFRLYLRALSGFEEREVTSGPLTGFNPFFSADGQWLAFFGETALYKAPVSGGVPERVASVHPGTAEGAWADDGTIVVSANYPIDNVLRRPLTRLAPNAAFEALTRPGPGESHHDPDILPGSTTVLFTLVTPQTSSILAVPLAGGEPRLVLADARRPRYTRAGYLVFQRPSSGDLMFVPFDPASLATSGEPIRIASAAHVVDSPAFDVARDGTIIYSEPGDTILQADFTVVAVDRKGAETQTVAEMRSWAEPRVSPDGRTLLLRDIVSPNCDLWTVDLHRGTKTRVTFEGDNHNPIWRPDGQMTWGSQVTGVRTIRMGRPGRPDRVEQLAEADRERVPASWSPDGTQLAFTEIHPVTGQDIWLLSMESGAARPFANSGYREHQAQFSPDGRWLAYVSNESGRDEVYIQPVDGDGGRLQVSVDSGHSPLWASEGGELFYVERSRLMGVSVALGQGQPDISRPRTFVEGPYVWERLGNYDATPDGTRFVFIRRTADADPSATLRVLLNWLTPR